MSLTKFIADLHQLAHGEFNEATYKTLRRMPAMDLQETGDAFVIKADVPGFTKNRIELNAHGSTLTIKGNIEISELLVLKPTAVINGDILTNKLIFNVFICNLANIINDTTL